MGTLNWTALAAIFTLVATSVHANEKPVGLKVDVTLDKEKAYPGETMSAECVVKTKEHKGLMVQWVQMVIDPATGDKEEKQLTVNRFVNEGYKERHSISIDTDSENDKFTFTLTIKDLKNSDSGEIGCKIPNQNIMVLKNLTVFGDIKELRFSSKTLTSSGQVNYADGEVVRFTEGEVLQFFCFANGGYPNPEVEIFSGTENITSKFERTSTLDKSEGVYDVVLKNPRFTIDYTMYQKKLGCKASIPGSNFEEKSVGFTVDLDGFKPKFLCEERVSVELNTPNFNVTCIVKAMPPITGGSITWQNLAKKNQTLKMGSSDGHYSSDPLHNTEMVTCVNMTASQFESLNDTETNLAHETKKQKSDRENCVWPVEIRPGESDNEVIMVLRIDRLFSQHFRKYYFHAENEKGNTTHTVHVVQAPAELEIVQPDLEVSVDQSENPEDSPGPEKIPVKTGKSSSGTISQMVASSAAIFMVVMATLLL